MTTIRSRSLVSLAAALTLTVALGGCAGNATHRALNDPAPVAATPATIRFQNEARQYVHVYLVGQNREWLLGRVEPGARTALRIPAEAMADSWQMQLAVVAGGRATMRVASQPGAQVTIAQSAGELLAQKWTFSQALTNGQATASLMGQMRRD
jgi:hypothetical protein